MGDSIPSKFFNLDWVSWSSELLLSSNKDRYCLGKLDLDRGQSLDPVPPHKIIGNKEETFMKKIIFI
tara:strand:+ start:60 stop:260 length:201 start_codon:yes stop_codon:yes gene_type:complete